MAADVGEAYVEIKPDTKGFGQKLRAELTAMRTGVKNEGNKAGQDYGKALGDGTGKGLLKGGFLANLAKATSILSGPAVGAMSQAAAAAISLGSALSVGAAGFAGIVPAVTSAKVAFKAFSLGVKPTTEAIGLQYEAFVKLSHGIGLTDAEQAKLNLAMAKLSPEATKLTKAIMGQFSAFTGLSKQLQDHALAGFADQVEGVSLVAQGLIPYLFQMVDIVNKLVLQISGWISTGSNLDLVTGVISGQITVFQHLSAAILPAIEFVLRLLDALNPLGVVVADLATQFFNWANASLAASKNNGGMAATIQHITDNFHLLVDIIKQVSLIVSNVFTAALPAGDSLLQKIDQVLAKFAAWTGSTEGKNSLAEWFATGEKFADDFGNLLVALGPTFQGLTKNVDTGQLLDALAALAPVLGTILGQLSNPDTVAAMAEAMTAFGQALVDMDIGGTMATTLTTFADFLKIVSEVVTSIPGGTKVLGDLFAILAVQKGIKLGLDVTGLAGLPTTLSNATTAVKNFGKGAESAFTAFRLGAVGMNGAGAEATRLQRVSVLAGNAFNSTKTATQNLAKTIGTNLKTAFMAAGAQIKAAATAVKSWSIWTKISSAATKVWAGIQAVFNAIMAANPIVLVVLGIVALIAVIVLAYKKFAWFRAFVDAMWKGILAGVKWVWGYVKIAFTAIVNSLKPIGAAIMSAFSVIWKVVGPIVKVWINLIVGYFKIWFKILKDVVAIVWAVIKTVIHAVTTFYGGMIKIWSAIVQVIWAYLKLAWGYVVKIFTAVWDFVKMIFTAVWGFIKAVWAKIIEAVRWALDNIVRPVINAFRSVYNWITDILNKVLLTIKTVWALVYYYVYTAVTKVWNYVKDKFQALANWLSGIWDSIKGKVTGAWNSIKDTVVNAVTNLYNGVKDWIDKVIDKVGGIKDKIWDKVSGFASMLYDSGKNLIQGLINGINDKIDAVGGAMGKIADKIKGFLPHSPAEEGPLSGKGDTLYSGQAITNRLAAGITKADDSIATAWSDALEPIQTPMVGSPTAAIGQLSAMAANRADGQLAALNVRVFIGDTELTNIVRTEVTRANDTVARSLVGGRRYT